MSNRESQSEHNNALFLTEGRELWLFSGCLMVILVVVFKDFLFGEKVLLYKDIGSDTINVIYSYTAHLIEYIKSEGIPMWSFTRGMGQNIFPSSLSDPTVWLLFPFGKHLLAYGVVYVEILKIAVAGLFFFRYLRLLSLTPLTSVIGGLLYSFQGFFILSNSGWFNHSFEPVFAALLLYAFELHFQRGKWWPLPAAFALAVSYLALHLYLFGLFISCYALIRYAIANSWQWRDATRYFARFFGLLLLGVGIASVFFISNLIQILESPRAQGNLSLFNMLSTGSIFTLAKPDLILTTVTRLFSVDMLGTGDAYRGWWNYLEAPALYCGVLAPLLIPQLFVKVGGKTRIILSAVLVVTLCLLAFPYARYAFWGFSGPYVRTLSLFITIVLLLMALHALSFIEREGKVARGMLFSTGLLYIALLFVPALAPADVLDSTLRTAVSILLAVYGVLTVGLISARFKFLAQGMLLLVVVTELSWFSWIPVNRREVMAAAEFQPRSHYDDITYDALQFLRNRDSSFYRVEKNYSSSPGKYPNPNDPQVLGYFGTTSYHSFNQPNYIRFLQAVEVIPTGSEPEARMSQAFRNHPRLFSLVSITYVFSKPAGAGSAPEDYATIASFGDVTVLENPNPLPLGFTYDHYCSEADFASLTKAQKDNMLMRAFVIRENDDELTGLFPNVSLSEVQQEYSREEFLSDIKNRRQDTLAISSWSQNRIRGTIAVQNRKMLFLSIPYDQGWSVRVDGAKARKWLVNIGFIGIPIEPGEHLIELEYYPPYLNTGLVVSSLSVFVFVGLLFRSVRKRR